jgi:hypothetical protein
VKQWFVACRQGLRRRTDNVHGEGGREGDPILIGDRMETGSVSARDGDAPPER